MAANYTIDGYHVKESIDDLSDSLASSEGGSQSRYIPSKFYEVTVMAQNRDHLQYFQRGHQMVNMEMQREGNYSLHAFSPIYHADHSLTFMTHQKDQIPVIHGLVRKVVEASYGGK